MQGRMVPMAKRPTRRMRIMSPKQSGDRARQVRKIEFWRGFTAEVDIEDILRSAVGVKGTSYHNPLRFLEIYGNMQNTPPATGDADHLSWPAIEDHFMPNGHNFNFSLGEDKYQPPFVWKDCDSRTLCISFLRNTNALFRILRNLSEVGGIPFSSVPEL